MSWLLVLHTVSTYSLCRTIMVTCVTHSIYLFSLLRPSWSLMLDTVSTYPPCHVHHNHSCVKVVSIPAILESIGINHLVGAA